MDGERYTPADQEQDKPRLLRLDDHMDDDQHDHRRRIGQQMQLEAAEALGG